MMMQISQTTWEQHHYRFGLAGEGQADIIQKHLSKHRGVLLDIGCGLQGRHVANLARFSDLVIAADKELGMVKNARADGVPKTVIFSVANVSHLPFFSHLFDAVVALGLFAYVTNPGQVFAELSRVTRHGGKVMVTNAVVHPKEPLVAAAGENGLRLIEEAEGYCPAASGVVKRRYLCVFETA